MTNSFVDYLTEYQFIDLPPEQAWEYFCEQNFQTQRRIIERYAEVAYCSAYEKGVHDKHWGCQGDSSAAFKEWKNKTK